MVDRWNDFCLGELPGPESVREAETWGPQHQIDFLEKNLLTPKVLRLKQGAKVMFTVNRPDDGFVNGQTGEVVSIGITSVVVCTEGRELEVSPYRWRYDSNDPGTAWFEQLPLRLANALTIHKAQGLTLDTAFIDIRAAREPGQAYVALSRVRTLAGLHLKDWPRGVFVSQRALDFHFPHSHP
jgi:ATP-dependent exoDNAse (exonuclease V) alpha subunit